MQKSKRTKIRNLSVFMTDFYKFGHKDLYPDTTTTVYSTLIPRNNTYFPYAKEMVVFGYELFAEKWLVDHYNENFFDLPIEDILSDYRLVIGSALGKDRADTKHIEDLHKLGYLPVEIKALPEGTLVPMGIPVLTIENTHPDFAWVSNYLETLLLSETFVLATTASMAFELRKVAEKYGTMTCDNNLHIPFQMHDFSERGQHGNGAAQLAGLGHLTSFVGTDTVQATVEAYNYYDANLENDLIGASVVASEHSVMQSFTKEHEAEAYIRSLNKFSEGILSLVSDTYDYFKILTELLPELKDLILSRDGKLAIRPDSGVPIDIIAGREIIKIKATNTVEETLDEIRRLAEQKDESVYDNIFNIDGTHYKFTDDNQTLMKYDLTPEDKGSLELLWETFGGYINDKGYRVLDSHIGLLFGEGITVETAAQIFERMERKRFAASNIVFGVGAYVYSVMISRDSFGLAFKQQYVVVDGEERKTFKDPATDKKKKSLKGRVIVTQDESGTYAVTDDLNAAEQAARLGEDQLQTIFKDGQRTRQTAFKTIRDRLTDRLPKN